MAYVLHGAIEKNGLRRKLVLNKIRGYLKGKKTYIVAVTGILGAITAWLNGAIESTKMLELVIECIMGVTIRSGISSGGKK